MNVLWSLQSKVSIYFPPPHSFFFPFSFCYFRHFKYKEYFGWIHRYWKLSANAISVKVFLALVATVDPNNNITKILKQAFFCKICLVQNPNKLSVLTVFLNCVVWRSIKEGGEGASVICLDSLWTGTSSLLKCPAQCCNQWQEIPQIWGSGQLTYVFMYVLVLHIQWNLLHLWNSMLKKRFPSQDGQQWFDYVQN